MDCHESHATFCRFADDFPFSFRISDLLQTLQEDFRSIHVNEFYFEVSAKDFLHYARELGLSATLRPSRGQDIDAACGQLAAKDLRGRSQPAVVPLG